MSFLLTYYLRLLNTVSHNLIHCYHMSSSLLSSLIQNLINGQDEHAKDTVHEYLLLKVQATLAEMSKNAFLEGNLLEGRKSVLTPNLKEYIKAQQELDALLDKITKIIGYGGMSPNWIEARPLIKQAAVARKKANDLYVTLSQDEIHSEKNPFGNFTLARQVERAEWYEKNITKFPEKASLAANEYAKLWPITTKAVSEFSKKFFKYWEWTQNKAYYTHPRKVWVDLMPLMKKTLDVLSNTLNAYQKIPQNEVFLLKSGSKWLKTRITDLTAYIKMAQKAEAEINAGKSPEGILGSSDSNKDGVVKFKVALMDEVDFDGYFDDEDPDQGGWTMCSAYVVTTTELKSFGIDDLDDLDHDDDLRHKFRTSLESKKIGKQLKDVKVKNPNPDLGYEGIEEPNGYKVILPF